MKCRVLEKRDYFAELRWLVKNCQVLKKCYRETREDRIECVWFLCVVALISIFPSGEGGIAAPKAFQM